MPMKKTVRAFRSREEEKKIIIFSVDHNNMLTRFDLKYFVVYVIINI